MSATDLVFGGIPGPAVDAMTGGLYKLTPGAVQALLAANRRELRLVNMSSFLVMRRLGLRSAFTFGEDFGEQGFEVVPG